MKKTKLALLQLKKKMKNSMILDDNKLTAIKGGFGDPPPFGTRTGDDSGSGGSTSGGGQSSGGGFGGGGGGSW